LGFRVFRVFCGFLATGGGCVGKAFARN
jgi:hypothetical protein